jgi:5-methylcytosine-specific restriction endonuclease McrA
MPSVPTNGKCSSLGCKNPRSKLNTYCLEHGGIDNMARRETDSAYQTPLWKSIRAVQISKQPLCQGCLSRNIVASAKHIDHLFAWKHIGSHAFSRNIFQSLCHNCHSQKSGLEKQGIYRHYAQDGAKDYTKNDYAYMLHQYNTRSE